LRNQLTVYFFFFLAVDERRLPEGRVTPPPVDETLAAPPALSAERPSPAGDAAVLRRGR